MSCNVSVVFHNNFLQIIDTSNLKAKSDIYTDTSKNVV